MSVSSTQSNRFAWMVISLLFAGSVINYMDRAVLGVVMPQIRRDLSLTNTDYGLAINAFLMTYMVFYILGGRMADRLGYRRSFSITVVFWSMASMLHVLAQGLASLCVFRALLGMGEGGFTPTAMRGVGDWFHSENRAKAVGLLLCGVSIGALLTPPIVAWLTLRHGWRASFLVTGALGFLLIPVWLFLHKRIQRVYGTPDPAPAYHNERGSGEPTREDLSLKEVLRQRKYWFILGARCVTDSVWFFYLFWTPGYFQDVRNFDLAMVGKLLWIPFFSADVGALFGAWTSSNLIQGGMALDRGRKLVLIPSALLCVAGAGAYFVPTHILSLVLVSLALFGLMSWAANLGTVITEITPRQHVAVLYGITGAAGTLTAAITQPLIGHLVDSVGYKIPFVLAGTSFLLAIALLLGAGKIEQMRRMGQGAEPTVVTSGVA